MGNQSFAYTLAFARGSHVHLDGRADRKLHDSRDSQVQASSFSSTDGTNVPGDNTTFGLQTETTSDTNGGYDLGFSSEAITSFIRM